jgi:hypothetical protein
MTEQEHAAPDVDVAIVQQPAPEPEPEPAGETAAEAVAEAQTDATEQSEIAILTARVIEQSEQLGRLSGLVEGLEGRYAPAGEYVTRTELESRLAAHEEPVEEGAVVVEPPEPEPLPEESTAEEPAPVNSGPPRIRFRW